MNQLAPPSRLRLENQVAVVTGGTRGIGEGIVRRFVQEGAQVVFSAAKFGVIGLTKSTALELAERGIRVNAICPGLISTFIWAPVYDGMSSDQFERVPEMTEPWLAEDTPLGRAGFPVDIANAALWLASSESSFVTGHALIVDGGLTAGRPWSRTLHRFDQLRERFRSALGQTATTS